VLTVDEEIYRLTPAFVIATVDKFARLAREGEAAALFGYVSRRCGRHGYVHADYAKCDITTSHPATKDGHPAATVRSVGRLRPPDLIIQDELHLITGALGTSVGLFEVAVEDAVVLADPRWCAGETANCCVDRHGAERPRAGAGPLRQAGGDLPPAGARRRRHLLLTGGCRSTAITRVAAYVGVSAQGVATVERRDPGIGSAAVRRPAIARPRRHRRGPLYDPRRVLQRDTGTGRDGPLHDRRRPHPASRTRGRDRGFRAATGPAMGACSSKS